MSIVFDKVKTKMNLIKEYKKNNNLNFSLSLSDAAEDQLKIIQYLFLKLITQKWVKLLFLI